MNRLRTRVKRLERNRAFRAGDLSDTDHAHMQAWRTHAWHKYFGGPPPTDEQVALIAAPGFWTRLQDAWGRPAWARRCVDAMEAARNASHSPVPE